MISKLIGKFKGFYYMEKAKDALKNEEGQALVEYALILALVAIVAIVALGILGGHVSNTFNAINNKLSTVGNGV